MATTAKSLPGLTAEDVMSRDVITIPVQTSLGEAARLLRREGVTGAPVVDEEGRCVAMLSAVDFLPWVEECGPGAAARLIPLCPYQTVGRLIGGPEAVICTLSEGSCPWQEARPGTGGRYTTLCRRPPRLAGGSSRVIAELPRDAVARWMTADIVTAGPHTPLTELARMMVDAHIHRIPVVDEGGRPVGIVSSTDLLAALARRGLR
jgi:CBS domain-containing protein